MIRILRRIFKTGIVTEPWPDRTPRPSGDAVIHPAGEAELEQSVRDRLKRSITIRQVDAGSCNGCELEIHAINNAIYNCERFGIHFTASPRFADVLLVTGPVSINMETALRRTYAAVPTPKLVLVVGDCGRDGGIFGTSYASLGGVDRVIPAAAVISGCPPTPEDILNGILRLFE
jgi:Ni,Fe-hydrogenase III small subunit